MKKLVKEALGDKLKGPDPEMVKKYKPLKRLGYALPTDNKIFVDIEKVKNYLHDVNSIDDLAFPKTLYSDPTRTIHVSVVRFRNRPNPYIFIDIQGKFNKSYPDYLRIENPNTAFILAEELNKAAEFMIDFINK